MRNVRPVIMMTKSSIDVIGAIASECGGFLNGKKWAIMTIGLALATLLSSLRAAWFWWVASRVELRTANHGAGSPGHALQLEGEAARASLLNARGAQ